MIDLLCSHGIRAGEDSWLCQMQGAMQQIGDLACILFTGLIALDLMLIIFFRRAVSQVNRMHYRVYAPTCTTISLLVGLIPLAIRNGSGERFYGDAGPWCWVSQSWISFQLYVFYLPLWLVFLFSVCVYVAVGRVIWKYSAQSSPLVQMPWTESIYPSLMMSLSL
jgi:hypothetical protein